MTATLIGGNEALSKVGLQFRIVGGVVSLITMPVEAEGLRKLLDAVTPVEPSAESNMARLQVLACIAYKQPVTYEEIGQTFGKEKRDTVYYWLSQGFVEKTEGPEGRHLLSVTRKFFDHFRLDSVEDFRRLMERPTTSELTPPTSAS